MNPPAIPIRLVRTAPGDSSFAARLRKEVDGEVLFESPRRVKAADGQFTDWFAGNDVHVYRLTKKPSAATP